MMKQKRGNILSKLRCCPEDDIANKLLHADSTQLSRFLLREKAAKTAPTYSPVSKTLAIFIMERVWII